MQAARESLLWHLKGEVYFQQWTSSAFNDHIYKYFPYSSLKKKKRKKDKKSSKAKKKRRLSPAPPVEEVEDHPLPPNIDLSSTLKELRTSSPTKNLIIPDIEKNFDSDDSEEVKSEELKSEGRREKREYSEGEWSSDSEGDSFSDGSKRDERV